MATTSHAVVGTTLIAANSAVPSAEEALPTKTVADDNGVAHPHGERVGDLLGLVLVSVSSAGTASGRCVLQR
jgi:hypothetical protein